MSDKYLLKTLAVGVLGANCYILTDPATRQAAVIDPGGGAGRIFDTLRQEQATLVAIINTHGHWDHIGGNKRLQELTDAPLLIHRLDAPMLSQGRLNLSLEFGENSDGGAAFRLLEDGDHLEVGGLTLSVIHTPGHTSGGICLQCEDLLFTGDTLFQLSVGRSDLPGGDEAALLHSLEYKLKPLDPSLRVLPGHGPESALGYEVQYNPYFPAAESSGGQLMLRLYTKPYREVYRHAQQAAGVPGRLPYTCAGLAQRDGLTGPEEHDILTR